MAVQNTDILKTWFRRGLYPTEEQFADLIDSFRHKAEQILISDVYWLSQALNSKADASEVALLETKLKKTIEDLNTLDGLVNDLNERVVEHRDWIKEKTVDLDTITGLLKEDSTLEEARTALEGLGSNYCSLYGVANTLKQFLESTDTKDKTINTWQEIENFLNGITDTESLTGLLAQIKTEITEEYKIAIGDAIKPKIGDAPADGKSYVRRNNEWVPIEEMPADSTRRLETVEQFIAQFPTEGDEIYAVVNRKAELIGDADEDVLTQAKVTAQTLALDAVKQGVMPVIDDEELLEEIRRLIGDDGVFAELMARSVRTLELQPEPTWEEKMAQAVAEYKARRAQEAAEAEGMRQLHDGTMADAMGAGESAGVSRDEIVKNVVKPYNTENNGTEAEG